MFAQRLTPHDVSLDDLLEAAMLTGAGPSEMVLHGVQRAGGTSGEGAGAIAADALDALVQAIAADLENWGLVPRVSESV
jgi:Ni,Fe-hydrogenase maturation factor